MKYFAIILACVLATTTASLAQSITDFKFYPTTGTYAPITGTQLLSAGADDEVSGNTSIGFTFSYLGTNYPNFAVSSNGYLMLLPNGSATATETLTNDLTANTTTRPVIAPLWDDLMTNTTDGQVQYVLTGSAPNRVLTVEWYKMLWNYTATSAVLTYQVELHESGGIRFNYTVDGGTVTSASASVGITASATGSGNYVSLGSLGTAPSFSSVSETNNIAAIPSANQSYIFTNTIGSLSAPTSLSFTSVGSSSMTLNWTNSTTYAGLVILRSTDNTNFTQVGYTSGSATSYNATGLAGGTTYYWRVHAANGIVLSSALSGSQATASGTMSGTFNIGPGQTFTSIKMAIDTMSAKGLAASVTFELQANYSSTVETFPLVFPQITGATPTSTITFRPAANATSISITGSSATAILDLSGVDFMTIDGRPGGNGNSVLTISNTSATTTTLSTIRLINGATNNTIQYCSILGATINTTVGTASGGGTIHFSTSLTTGNSNNTFRNCNVGPVNATTAVPHKAVYAYNATTSLMSLNNTFSNCNFYDMFYAAGTNYWFYLGTGNAAWNFNSNSIYQTQTRTQTASNTTYIFYCASSTINQKYTFDGNFIGGTAPQCGGSAMTINTSTTTLSPTFYGIYGSRSSSLLDTMFITNNTFAKINWTSASTSTLGFNCVYSISGPQYIVGNTIGSISSNNNIVLNCSATGTTGTGFSGIYAYSSVTTSPTIINSNTIGGISLVNSSTSSGGVFQGIYLSSTTGNGSTVNNNILGSPTVSNSISTSSGVTGTVAMRGIYLTSSSGAISVEVSNNQVSNITCNGSSTTSGGQFVHGIFASSGIHSITNNTIKSLSNSASNASSTNTTMSVVGITQGSSTAPSGVSGHVISNNTIHTLKNTHSTATGTWVVGIAITSAGTSSNLVSANSIHSLSTLSSATTAATNVLGILAQGGPTTYQNNMVRLGIDENGSSINTTVGFQGIQKTSANPANFWHNSIYIGGNQTPALAVNAIGLWRNGVASTGLDDIRNNIIQIARTGATLAPICMLSGSTTTTTTSAAIAALNLNNNLYFHNGTTSWIGGIQTGTTVNVYSTMSGWRGISANDGASGYGNPNFANPTGSATTGDIHINTSGATAAESGGVLISSVSTDFDGQTRSGLTPTDIGADAGDFTLLDIFPPTISYTPFVNGIVSTSREVSGVVITDASGINTNSGLKPRLYFRKSTEANTYVGNTSTDNGWKWVEASNASSPFSFTIDYSLLNSSLSTNDTITYFVVAQDLASTPNFGVNNGAFTSQPTSVNLSSTNFPVGSVRFFRILPQVSGTIAVGPSEAINSITNTGGLFDFINNRVVSGNLTVTVTGNLTAETGTIALNQTIETGTGNYTLTIRPAAGTTDTISGSFAPSTNGTGLIRLNGADRVIIDGRRIGDNSGNNLLITNTSTTHGASVIQLMSLGVNAGATRDTIRFCNIVGGAIGTPSASTYGVQLNATGSFTNPASTTTATGSGGSDNDFVAITNNVFERMTWGVYARGNAGSENDSLLVANNIFGAPRDSTSRFLGSVGIEIFFTNGASIRNNFIRNIISANLNPKGINVGTGVTNSIISNNRIQNLRFSSTGGYGAKGIDVYTGNANANLVISNNMLTTLSGDGWTVITSDAIVGIRLGNTISTVNGKVAIVNNTVLLRDTLSPTTSTGRLSPALYIGASSTEIDVRNNILVSTLVNNTTTTQSTFAFYSAAPSSAFTSLDNNNYFVNAGSQGILGYFDGANRTTLAALQTASGRDLNSTNVSVSFVSDSTDLHLASIQPLLKGTSAVSSIVSTDFDGTARTHYYMGADEVKPVLNYTSQLTNETKCPGDSYSQSTSINTPITFDDNVQRTAPSLTYQWFKDGSAISGQTNTSYSISSVASNNAGTYQLRSYASSIDSVTSSSVLTVNTTTSISQHPQGGAVCLGAQWAFSVNAQGTNLTYQWRRGSTNIAGATNATHTINNVTATDYATYTVVVSGACGNSTSNSATLTQISPTAITSQLAATPSTARCAGETVTLSLTATGDNISYVWKKDSQTISGATTNTYTVSSFAAANAGVYTVDVIGTCGTITSSSVTLTLTAPTIISGAPTATASSICLGGTSTLSVNASAANISYQWRKAASPIANATNSSYTIASATASDFGSYDVVVTGTCGSQTSSSITITQIAPTVITLKPSQSANPICLGQNGFSFGPVAATGANVTYQWQKNVSGTWTNIAGATNTSYVKTSTAVVISDSGSYRVNVIGTCGTLSSNVLTLTINQTHTVGTPTWDRASVCTGESATISVTITPTVTGYQWRKNGTTITGATNSTYSIQSIALSDAGDYSVIVSGPCTSNVISNNTNLAVQQNVTIVSGGQPQAQTTLCAGSGSISLSVQTLGTVVSYTWEHDRTRSGNWVTVGTGASYTDNNITVLDSGNYRVQIIGTCSTIPVVSNNANVIINTPFTVTSQPTWQSTPTAVGSNVSLSVGTTGSATFQWQRDVSRTGNWQTISGATNGTYVYTVATNADSGNYRCIISGPCGPASVNSSVASVYTCQQATITQQPQTPSPTCPGGSLSLSISATGDGLSYQWQQSRLRNNVWTNVGTGTSFSKTNVTASDSGDYRMVITNNCALVTTSNTVYFQVRQPVSIAVSPTPQTVCAGASSVSFTATGNGTDLFYQWYYNGAPIPAGLNNTAQLPTLVVSNITTANAGTYYCSISNACSPSGVNSNPANLTVNTQLQVVTQPTAPTTQCLGNPVVLSVTANGSGVTFKWRKNGSTITGATTSTYSFTPATTADNGSYDVLLTGACGSATSNAVALSFNTPASIVTQPTAQTVCAGAGVSITTAINAAATSPTYQWFVNGQPVNSSAYPSALSPTLVIPTTSAANNGTYYCKITSACQPNGITTNSVALVVNSPIAITSHPASTTVCVGQNGTLTVGTTGSTPVAYQWYKNNTPINGATSNSYSIPSAQLSDAGSYSVGMTNVCTTTELISSVATLTVNQPIAITSAALTNQATCQGGTITLSTSATGTGVQYQWRRNGVELVGQTSNTITLAAVQPANEGSYDCLVKGACSPTGVATNIATLTVNTPVVITNQPQSTTVCQGQPLLLSAAASGSGAQIQWRLNGSNIPFANSFVYSVANATAGMSGNYDAIVTGTCGAVGTTGATVTVQTPLSIIQQPTQQVGCPGGTLATVIGTSGTALGFQWLKDGVAISGQTNATIILNNITSATSGLYSCRVLGSSACGTATVTSTPVAFFVGSPTTITTEPRDRSVSIGSTITIEVEANGTGFAPNNQLRYTWFKGTSQLTDNARFSGTSTSVLTIRGVLQSDIGNDYHAVVSGQCSETTTRKFALTIASVNVVSQPQAQTVCSGANVSFNVSATPSSTNATLSYQWFKGSTPLSDGASVSGATTTTLSLSNVAAADADDYLVRITVQPGGTVQVSDVAKLIVNSRPAFTLHPSNQEVCVGAPLTLETDATGGSITYQWFLDGNTVPGATGKTVVIPAVPAAPDGDYSVTVRATNNCGNETSNQATITVRTAPVITTQPASSLTIDYRGQLSMSVVATGSGVSYQWRKNGTNIPGATNATYSKQPISVDDNGTYTCQVLNSCGEVVTQSAVVIVTDVVSAEEAGLRLQTAEPNPVRDVAAFHFTIPSSMNVRLYITDAAGRTISTITDGVLESGNHTAYFNANDATLASGAYNIVLRAGSYTMAKRFIIVK